MTTTPRNPVKLYIPQAQEPGVSIVGVLEQLSPGDTRGRKLALVCSIAHCSNRGRLQLGQILHGSLG